MQCAALATGSTALFGSESRGGVYAMEHLADAEHLCAGFFSLDHGVKSPVLDTHLLDTP